MDTMSDILEQSHIHDMEIEICRECIVYTMYNQTECVYVYIIVYIYRLLSPLRTIYGQQSYGVWRAGNNSVNQWHRKKQINTLRDVHLMWERTSQQRMTHEQLMMHTFWDIFSSLKTDGNCIKLEHRQFQVGSMLYIHLSASVYKSSIYSHNILWYMIECDFSARSRIIIVDSWK